MSFVSTHFVYDGVKSEDMGIYIIKTSSSMIERQFAGEREIVSEMVNGNHTPYILGQKVQPLKLKLQLSPLEEQWTSELKASVMRWLNNGKFNEFYSTDDVNRRFFISYVGSPTISLSGSEQGWIDVDFVNIDCFVRSPVYEKRFDLSTINSPSIVELENLGDRTIYPNEMWIEKVGAGDLSIRNLSDGGRDFKFTGLNNGEKLYIKNMDRYIETNIPSTYRYDSFSGNYIRLNYGVNRFEVTGPCRLKIEYRYEFLSS